MKLTKKQQKAGLLIGLAALGTIAVLAVSPIGNFFTSNLFGSNPAEHDAGLYLPYNQTTASGTYMRVGTGVHLGTNNTRYGTGSTMRLRAVVTLVPRNLDVNSFSGVLNYNPQALTVSPSSLLMTGSGFTVDNAITRVVRNAADSESLYFSIDRNAGNFIKRYHQFLTVEMTPQRPQSSYELTLNNLRFLDTKELALGTGDSLYLERGVSPSQGQSLVVTPGTNYIIERTWTDGDEYFVEETLYNATNDCISVTERVYDNDDGHLIRETITEFGPDGTTPIREIYREYYDDGVIIRYERETVYNPDGTQTVTEREYDEDGNLIREETTTIGTPTPGDRAPVVNLSPVQGITTSAATFSWSGSDMDAGETFSYRFCLSTNQTSLLSSCEAPTGATSLTRSNLSSNTQYFWTVLVSDGTTSNVPAANGPMNFRTATPPVSGGGGGGGGSATPPPVVNNTGGAGGGFEGEFILPAEDDPRSVIVYGSINFRIADGYVRLILRHVDKATGMEIAYTKGTRVTNEDGTGFTGIYNPLIRYPLADLRQPMRGLLPSDMTLAYEYFMQYGNLRELYSPNLTLRATIGALGVPDEQLVILGWDFQQQKWVQVGDASNIVNGELTLGLNKSTIIGIFRKTTVSQAETTGDICDDARNPNRTPFRDANSHWATSYICKLYNLGAITGYTDGPFRGLFRPDNSITRAELLKIMMAAEGIQVDTSRINSGFPDVPTYEWFAPYVTRARELRLIDGYPDGTFQPFRQINRSEALKIILNASRKIDDTELANQVATYKSTPPARSAFNDITTSDWFAPYIDLAAGKGIISGKQPGIFRAGDDITRAEVSKVIQLTITLP